jgi:hypothetical protein
MAGQGKTTKAYADQLKQDGWKILFLCIPNSVHFGVVPIPTSHGVSKQRYPDIAALKDGRLLFVEVEMALTESVVDDIILRFGEMRKTLANRETFHAWATKVAMVSETEMPMEPLIDAWLLVVKGVGQKSIHLLERLQGESITLVSSPTLK